MTDYKKKISLSVKIPGVLDEEIFALLVPPKESAHGDYALPCFKFSGLLRQSPQSIAAGLAETLNKGLLPEFLSEVTAVAGYLNFRLDKSGFAKNVLENFSVQVPQIGAGKTVCIDYSSVNIAKPFHIGHLRATVLGGALYRIYKKLGYKTVGINHLGDWGTQFGKLIVAYKKWGKKSDVDARGVRSFFDIYTKYHKESETDKTLDDEARAWFKKIEDGDAEALSLFEFFKQVTLNEVAKIYKRLHIEFDSYAGESFYNDKMSATVDELSNKGLLEKSDGASVVKFAGDEMPPCLILRSDGASLYATRDLSAVFYRKKTYDFDKCLYVVAYQQNLHFKQIFKVVELMGYDWAKDLEHVAFGMVSLEGEAMSTRSGHVAFLDEVLDRAVQKAKDIILEKSPDLEKIDGTAEKIGIGAAIFGVLYGSRIKDIDFRWSAALSFEGETAPYVQYTVCRASSVLEKYDTEIGTPAHTVSAIDYSGLDNPEGAETLKLLADYTHVVSAAAEKFEPGLVARYAVDLAQAFNRFYFEHSILKAERRVVSARLALARAVKETLTDALYLLGIDCPEKM